VRILSLGFPLPDAQVDNYDWAKALSFFDYDAIVVDPAVAVSDLVEGVIRDGMSYTSYNEEVVQNGPTTAYTIGLADLLRRRADETERLLGKGGLVVCFAYPDVPHPKVANFTGCHRYYWLPAPAGAGYGPDFMRPAAGLEAEATDFEHPFADFFERHRKLLQYRAIFADGGSSFANQAKVIARSPGGAAIALDIAAGGGRIVFLPALPVRLNTSDRTSVASTLVSAIRNLLLLSAEGSPPAWLSGFSVPGLQKARLEIDRAEVKADEAEADLDEARNEYRALDRYRRVLWQEGKYGLELPVRDALGLLGMTNMSAPDDPGVFLYGGERVFLETEGSAEAIGLTPHYRLRQRIERELEGMAQPPRGLIVINGYRDKAPGGRSPQYEEALKMAAETMSYCVIESSRLFDAVRAKMAGQDDDVAGFLKDLLATRGVYEGPMLAVDIPDETEEPEHESEEPAEDTEETENEQ
jgi:hypothetical protein